MKEPKFEEAIRCLQKKLNSLYEDQGRYNLAVQRAAVQEAISEIREAISLLRKYQVETRGENRETDRGHEEDQGTPGEGGRSAG